MARKPAPPATVGAGELRCQGFLGEVRYRITGDPAGLTATNATTLRGSLVTDAAVAAAAFRAGSGYLTLENGKACRITLLGYTVGSDTAYFEIRV